VGQECLRFVGTNKSLKERGNNHTKGQRASSIGIERQKGEEGARKCQKKQKKTKQQRRRREQEAPGEQEMREGTRRGLKRHAEAPQQGVELGQRLQSREEPQPI